MNEEEMQEEFISAVDIVVKNEVAKLKYDKTVPATIWKVVNLDTGEYKVRYSGNIFSAFSNDLKQTYKVKDTVYIMIPEGDLSNRKVIVSKITNSSLSYGEMVSLTNAIVERSPTFDKFYDYETGEYGVVAGAPQPPAPDGVYSQDIVYSDTDGYHGLFQQYANKYELIRIKASFLTRFHSEHTHGNYGLEIAFFTKGEGEVGYRLDLESFNGDPYSLSVYSPQSAIIKTQKNYLTGLKYIKLFEENFSYDKHKYTITDETGTTVEREEEVTTEPNIFVKDISIQFVEQKNLTDNVYYLDIATPQGNVLSSSSPSLDLVGRLLYQGENIMEKETCECKWFKRDLSVSIGNELYDKNAGAGWTPAIPSAYDTMTVKRKTPTNARGGEEETEEEYVIHQQRYKLVATYNKSVVLTDEVEVLNLGSGYDYEIAQKTSGDTITLELVNKVKDTPSLVGDWYYSYPDGSYNEVRDGKLKSSIPVQDYLTYAYVTFYCAVHGYKETESENEIIGTIEWTINNSTSGEDVIIAYDGEDTFRYDANGDIAITDAEKERTLRIILTWKNNVATSYKVEWIGPDGELITSKKQNPSYSMIENLWFDNSTNLLHYSIKPKYKNNYNNNTITVNIKTIDEQTYTFKKELLFLKDGDQGTNGTTYVTAVRPYDPDTKQKLSGFHPLIYRDGWIGNLLLKCYVYKDGELINDVDSYTITYKWNSENLSITGGTSTSDSVIVRGIDDTLTKASYVKVKTTISDNINGGKYSIYCSYPIDVSVGFTDEEIEAIDINDIPSYIKYTASGINPQFYNNIINKSNYIKKLESLTTDVLEVEPDGDGYSLKPASSLIFVDVTSFENINLTARLKGTYNEDKYIYHPIILYLDTYGNEAINGWDGTKLELDENGQYIFAPQIGAGIKDDEANTFTGVVMGKDSVNKKVGLYGYQKGINTFGLMEDGRAYFGAKSGGGQIVIDGTSAEIYGGGYADGPVGGEANNGMTITLANRNPEGNPYAIKIADGKFGVKYDGTMTATGADIEGAIYATSGKIGGPKNGTTGWTITADRLYSGSGTSHVELNSNKNTDFAIWAGGSGSNMSYSSNQNTNGSKISSPAKFVVTRDGYVHMNEAYIKGNIYADYISANDGGKIGGWTINSRGLYASSGKVGLTSTGTYRLWVNADRSSTTTNPSFSGDSYFWVNNLGQLKCRGATVIGGITATSLYIGNSGTDSVTGNGLNSYALNDGAVTENKINNGAVTENKIGRGAISSVKIQNGAIIAEKIQNGAVGTTKIAGGAITTEKISTKAITTEKINTNAITSEKINANAITAGKIASNAITSNNIQSNAITAGKIASNAISADNIQSGAITAGKIASDAISANNIQSGAITSNKIASNAISAGNIQSGAIQSYHIEAGAITADKIAAGELTAGKVKTGDGLEIYDDVIVYGGRGEMRFSSGGLSFSGMGIDFTSETTFDEITLKSSGKADFSSGSIDLGDNVTVNGKTLSQYIKDTVGTSTSTTEGE